MLDLKVVFLVCQTKKVPENLRPSFKPIMRPVSDKCYILAKEKLPVLHAKSNFYYSACGKKFCCQNSKSTLNLSESTEREVSTSQPRQPSLPF